ncbi:MAG: hypothetical protein SNI51_00200 [Rikenellaceae bacterium]
MSYIESAKSYTGNDLETIFFRPMLSGPSAEELGVKIIYNMPLPTTIQLWKGQSNVLQRYTTNGWSGGSGAIKQQKTINLDRVKAELGFSAADYFSLVFEQIASRSDINMDDLTGSELETAETELFRRSIAESIRATMWVGDTDNDSGFNTFNGFLKAITEYVNDSAIPVVEYTETDLSDNEMAVGCFDELWGKADQKLKDMKGEGQLVYFVTSDIYNLYEKYLDEKGVDSSYVDAINGRSALMYHGIPVVDMHIGNYLADSDYDTSFSILTDRRNLVMAVNTSDFPGAEIRMWYNPDEMENRQRAVFMAGCDIIDEELLVYAHLTVEQEESNE